MTAKRSQKQKKRFGACRKCSICGGKTISAHLGMNACRACSIFYRRSAGKRVYDCRNGDNKCAVSKGSTCRKCRFDLIERLIGRGQSGQLFSEESSPHVQSLAHDSEQCEPCEPSTSSTTSILERVRSAYRTMSHIRLTGELIARPNPPHPMLMNEEDFPLEQATMGTKNNSNRIFLSTVVGFGKMAFPEFGQLSKEHQWKIAVNFAYRFSAYESSYRADKRFPDEPDRLFSGYTYWFTHNYDDRFYSDCPNQIDLHQVKTSMYNHCKGHHRSFRAFMKRVSLTESEFMLIAAIMFWTIEGLDLPEHVVSLAERHKKEIMGELHAYFRDERGMADYAARLGELLTALELFDKRDMLQQNYEYLRLMNVLTDDTFVYQLQRENTT